MYGRWDCIITKPIPIDLSEVTLACISFYEFSNYGLDVLTILVMNT